MPKWSWLRSNTYLMTLVAIGGTLVVIAIAVFVLNYSGITSVIWRLVTALIPLLFSVGISVMVEPIILWLGKKIHRVWAVIITYLVLVGFIGVIGVIIIPMVVDQLTTFFTSLPELIDRIQGSLFVYIDGIGMFLDIQQVINDYITRVTNATLNEMNQVFNGLYALVLTSVGAVFLSLDYPSVKESIKRGLPDRIKRPVISYFHRFLPYIHRFVAGMMVDSTILWITSTLVFALADYEYAIVFALFVVVANFIPVVGPFIGGFPVVLYRLTISIEAGIVAALLVTLLQFVESNILQPTIMKNNMALHPLENVIGLVIFGSLFGIGGMVISPILMTALKLLLNHPSVNREGHLGKMIEEPKPH